MKNILSLLFFGIIIIFNANAQQIKNQNQLQEKKILVFTKNGKGYVHDNIAASIAALQKLGASLNFKVDTTTSSTVFTDDNLKKYAALVFSNTNNNVFDTEEQKVAFMRYIQAGGGFMGIHSASGTERNWKWFKLMLGATFLRHPPFQSFNVYVLDKNHPATKNLMPTWQTNDECYFFKEFNPAIKVLAVSDISTIKEATDSLAKVKNITPDVFGNQYPCVWCNNFDGGKIWYTSLGHSIEDYSNNNYLSLLKEGLLWVTNNSKLDYTKATATNSILSSLDIHIKTQF